MATMLSNVSAYPAKLEESQPLKSVSVENLHKKYGETHAVRGITLEVSEGEIFGLIGPDGAGKTSTFQVLAGVMEATSGAAKVFGKPARAMRLETGYLTQTFSLYPDLSVSENIRYIGDLRRVPHDEIVRRSERYLGLFGMYRFQDRLAGRLSGGMKQKLALVCALVPEPRVLLLDEPTTGVDPVSRREFWDVLARLAAEGLTVLVATPYLDEAERCHRVALMHSGEIQYIGTPSELRRVLGLTRLEFRTPQLPRAEQLLSGPSRLSQIIDVQRFGDRLDLLVEDSESAEKALVAAMARSEVPVDEVRADEPTLENTFVTNLRRLGHRMHDEPFPGRHDHKQLAGNVAIGAEHLTKRFGDFTAVKDVSLKVHYGEIYGFLGANGAGKTTTIKMLCALLPQTEGATSLAGERGNLQTGRIRRQIGYMSQKFSLYDDLTIEQNLDFFAEVYGVPEQERVEKRKWVLSFSGLEGKEKQITGSLPGGWKQRVAFGAAIMHEPSILFLDEPTSGVDPLARRAFWSMINHLADAGTAILVTTHYLEEAEQCNRLGLMVAGELAIEGTPSEIKKQQQGHLLEFLVDQPQRAADALRMNGERWRVSLFGDRLHVVAAESAELAIRNTTKALEARGVQVISAREARFSLEDVFINVVESQRLQGKFAEED
jgi:ABC-2 type transport system ATP-binding protein